MLRGMLAATFVALIALVLVVRAEASPYVRYGVQDDAWLLGGPGTLDERLTKLERLGVELVRVNLRWDQIAAKRPAAPADHTDPAYRWLHADVLLQGLRAHGIEPVVTLVGTPRWANGNRRPSYAPRSGAQFAAFAYAASTRFRFVRSWLVWNEPNQDWQLRPTTPATYVHKLLNPAYGALKRADRSDRVGGGVTAPRGDVSPYEWIRGMRASRARFDAYAHNPHPLNPREPPLATVAGITREVTRAFGAKRIWLTEFAYQTNPPDRLLGVSEIRQAEIIGEAALHAYRAPRVDMLIHFLVRDELDVGRWQSGLFTQGDTPKLAATAFPLPLAQVSRSGATTTLWGHVRVGASPRVYRLRLRYAGRWRWIGADRTAGGRGFFTLRVRAPRGSFVQLWADGRFGVPLRIR